MHFNSPKEWASQTLDMDFPFHRTERTEEAPKGRTFPIHTDHKFARQLPTCSQAAIERQNFNYTHLTYITMC